MKYYIILYTCILLITIACKKDKNPSPPGGGSIQTLNSYPLQLGNEWKYHTTVSFTSDSFNAFFNDYATYRFDSITSFGGYDSVYALIAVDSTDDGSIYHYTNYYFQNQTGLYHAGYIFGSNPRVFLRNGKQIQFKLGNKVFDNPLEAVLFFNKVSTDSLIIENPPLLTLKFPAIQNHTWIYRNYDEPFYIGKKYSGFQNVNTAAGNFFCYKVKLLYDFNKDGIIDPDITITQFISPTKGLVKTDFQAYMIVTDTVGAVIDTGYFSQQSILTAVNF